jgi:hypothetical protein
LQSHGEHPDYSIKWLATLFFVLDNVTLVTECWLARCHLTVMRGQLRFELA